eukprot:GHVQ01023442.1.p1 GENE.GHVQ01023442.1~~GHVQ01023442.1.p1  ORF type:complete len:995 (+),score=136.68 GHVQ01023442.1:2952-5936(+)
MPEFCDLLPEFSYFRDIVFMFKALIAPSAEGLPDIRRWSVKDASLQWSYASSKKTYIVKGFRKTLECTAFVRDDYYEQKRKATGVFTRLFAWMGVGAKQRAPPSAADPSNLIPGQQIESEDDVLHIKKLPDFEGRLSGEDCELLLQYLTAPYLRIPLILQFFSDERKLDCLLSCELRTVVSAAMFEPSLWQAADNKPCPETVPPMERSYLATPAGVLFNELKHSPKILLHSLEEMLDIALDKDTGRYKGCNAQVLLYVLRLIVAVLGYLKFLLRHDRYWMEGWRPDRCGGRQATQRDISLTSTTTDMSKPSAVVSRCGWGAKVKGLECRRSVLNELGKYSIALERRMKTEVLFMLEAWALKATEESELHHACIMHAHIVYMYKDITWEEMNSEVVGALLNSVFFVFSHHNFHLEAQNRHGGSTDGIVPGGSDDTDRPSIGCYGDGGGKHYDKKESSFYGESLGVPDMELFGIVQDHRVKLVEWLEEHESESNEIMESVVRSVTFTGTRTLTNKQIQQRKDAGAVGRVGATASIGHRRGTQDVQHGMVSRGWQQLRCFGGRGRFAPDSEISEDSKSNTDTKQCVEQEHETGSKAVRGKSKRTFDMSSTLKKAFARKSRCNAAETGPRDRTYEEWMREVVGVGADTEINLQLTEFSLKNNPMVLLGEWVNNYQDFIDLFGKVSESSTYQSALVAVTSQRYWCRLVGRRHDLIRWSPIPAKLAVSFTRRYIPQELMEEEGWLPFVLDRWMERFIPGAELYLEDPGKIPSISKSEWSASFAPPSASVGSVTKHRHDPIHDQRKVFVRLMCVYDEREGRQPVTLPFVKQYQQVTDSEERLLKSSTASDIAHEPADASTTPMPSRRDGGSDNVAVVGSGIAGGPIGEGGTLKEIVVIRSPPTVLVFDIVEHGRKFYRTLCYTSDCSCSLDGCSPSQKCVDHEGVGGAVQLVGGVASARGPGTDFSSVVITRNLTKEVGVQTYVPSRFLKVCIVYLTLHMY